MKFIKISRLINKFIGRNDNEKILLGKILSNINNEKKKIASIHEVEFKVFSQFGDDGIIQYLTSNIEMPKSFIEFGVETYHEANTRFLLINDNWSGLIMDGSKKNIQSIIDQDIYYRFDLKTVEAFITVENINSLISSNGFSGEIGILSVDIDGNDYWVLKSIDVVNPVIIIVEYNSTFGTDRYIAVPYESSFYRTSAHFSNLFFGASLSAFASLCNEKGYTLVGCNSNGNNAYFVRNDKIGDLPTPSIEEAFVKAKFRESRDQAGKLTYLPYEKRMEALKGMKVVNVKTNELESL